MLLYRVIKGFSAHYRPINNDDECLKAVAVLPDACGCAALIWAINRRQDEAARQTRRFASRPLHFAGLPALYTQSSNNNTRNKQLSHLF